MSLKSSYCSYQLLLFCLLALRLVPSGTGNSVLSLPVLHFWLVFTAKAFFCWRCTFRFNSRVSPEDVPRHLELASVSISKFRLHVSHRMRRLKPHTLGVAVSLNFRRDTIMYSEEISREACEILARKERCCPVLGCTSSPDEKLAPFDTSSSKVPLAATLKFLMHSLTYIISFVKTSSL